jgi:hypothetical protein
MNKLIYPPSQKTTGLPVGEREEEIASGDLTGWASHTAHQRDNPAVSFAKQNWRGKFRYHALARGVFHLAILIFLISGCKTTPKKEDGKITSKDMDKEFSDRRALPSFHTDEKDTVKTHIDDRRYKTEDGEE